MRGLVLFLFLLLALPVWADQLIIEPDMGVAPVKAAILDSQHSLDLVMYGFTEQTLLNALLRQHQRGLSVKVLLQQRPYKTEEENEKTIRAFDTNHLPWQGQLPGIHLIHQKTLIMDGQKAMVMTFNFTHAAFKNERNFALIIDDPQRVRHIQAIFSADWNHVPVHNEDDHLIYSPDDSREQLLSFINHARYSIRLYTQSLSDYKIVGALAKAARKGIKVEILTSAKISDKQAAFLQRAGVNVQVSQHYYIHAKVFIIDDQKAIIGSINLTRASLDKNRELSVVTEDKTVIQGLNRVFNQDWKNTWMSFDDKNYLLSPRVLKHAAKLIRHYINPV